MVTSGLAANARSRAAMSSCSALCHASLQSAKANPRDSGHILFGLGCFDFENGKHCSSLTLTQFPLTSIRGMKRIMLQPA